MGPLAIRFILKDCQKLGVVLAVDDYKQIYQYLLAVEKNGEQSELMKHLIHFWDKSNTETTVTKFE